MTLAVGIGVLLVFMGRLAYHALYRRLRASGRIRSQDPDQPGLFLATVGVAISLWFALDAIFGWQTPVTWRLAAICTGFLLAEGVVAGAPRR